MPDILLVEDSVVDVEIMREALTDLDFKGNLHVVEDGEVALQFLRKEENFQSVTRPDIVLLDLNLPKVNGQEVLQSVKADFGLKTIPVLVLSTSCSHFDVKAAYSLGANSYLQKPSRYNELVLMLNRVLTFWLKHDLSRKVSGLS